MSFECEIKTPERKIQVTLPYVPVAGDIVAVDDYSFTILRRRFRILESENIAISDVVFEARETFSYNPPCETCLLHDCEC